MFVIFYRKAMMVMNLNFDIHYINDNELYITYNRISSYAKTIYMYTFFCNWNAFFTRCNKRNKIIFIGYIVHCTESNSNMATLQSLQFCHNDFVIISFFLIFCVCLFCSILYRKYFII